MNRLQPIANIRQRPRGDRREGINEIALGEGDFERRINDEIVGLHLACLATSSPNRHPGNEVSMAGVPLFYSPLGGALTYPFGEFPNASTRHKFIGQFALLDKQRIPRVLGRSI